MIVHPNGSLEGTPEELAAYQAIQERLPEASRHRVRWPQLYPDFYSPPVQGPRFCDDWRAGGESVDVSYRALQYRVNGAKPVEEPS